MTWFLIVAACFVWGACVGVSFAMCDALDSELRYGFDRDDYAYFVFFAAPVAAAAFFVYWIIIKGKRKPEE